MAYKNITNAIKTDNYFYKEVENLISLGSVKMEYNSKFLDFLDAELKARYYYHNVKVLISKGQMLIILLKYVTFEDEEVHRKVLGEEIIKRNKKNWRVVDKITAFLGERFT